jgi:hypothetical protein
MTSPLHMLHSRRRLQYKPEQIRWEDVQEEACSGKQLITREVDNAGRPVMLLRPR